VLALLAAGCSATRFAYDNADVFLRWQAGRYLDLHAEQSEELDARIASFLAWHRAAALPGYVRLANEAGARLERGLSREDLVWGYDSFQTEARRALRAAAGEVAGLLDRMTPEQVAHLERRFAEDNRRFAKEQLSGTVEERRKRRFERNRERLEEWFGDLGDAQLERVRRYNERVPLSGELRDRERRRLQGELVAMIRARKARERLADWAASWDRDREPAYAAFAARARGEYFDMLLDLERTLTPAQRQAAVARLRAYAADFEQLARR
jgi:hypothetical protein